MYTLQVTLFAQLNIQQTDRQTTQPQRDIKRRPNQILQNPFVLAAPIVCRVRLSGTSICSKQCEPARLQRLCLCVRLRCACGRICKQTRKQLTANIRGHRFVIDRGHVAHELLVDVVAALTSNEREQTYRQTDRQIATTAIEAEIQTTYGTGTQWDINTT